MEKMTNEKKRRATQDVVDAANMGQEYTPAPVAKLQQVISERAAAAAAPKEQYSEKQLNDAAMRNAEINHRLMMEQIEKERAAKRALPPEPQEKPLPELDLSALANENADRQMYPDRFKNLKKPRGK